MKKRPNILIFNPDQFRSDALGHLGNNASKTPNFDKIIQKDAVSFRNAFCQNPVCTPSRCSFMSGWYPHVHGHRTMKYMLHLDEPVLLKTLKDEGYFVWWGGKNDLVPAQEPLDPYCTIKNKPKKTLKKNLHNNQYWRGEKDSDNYFSFYAGKLKKDKESGYYDSDWDNIFSAINLIKNLPEDKPLCIYLPIEYPHPPYGVEEPWYSCINREELPKRITVPNNWIDKPSILKGIYEGQNLKEWTEDRWSELRATYLGMCSRVDYQFGMVMDALKEAGIYDDTVVFVFSDHGDFTGDYGLVEKTQNTFEDCLTNVPFIIKPPADIAVKPGIRDALVELIDFPATVEELLGIKPKHTHFGKSLIPIIVDKKEKHRDFVFCEGGRLHEEVHCMEVDDIENINSEGLYWPRLNLQISDGPEHTKAIMIRDHNYKYVYRLYEKDELYDLKNDPMELNNRIEDSSLMEVLNNFKLRLLQFYVETSDVVPFEKDKR